jgi:hypothetical protein
VGLQKPKLWDVFPRIESGVLSFNFIMHYWGCAPLGAWLSCVGFAPTLYLFLIYLSLSFVLFEVFNNLPLLPIFFSLYPNPQKFQKDFSFYPLVLRDSNCLQWFIWKREDFLSFQEEYHTKEECENLYERYVLCLPLLMFGCLL